MKELTQEQVIERGVVAKALLTDERYMSFFQEQKQLILESIANTKPEERATRETLYHQLNGLSDVLGTMQSYVDAAEAILKLKETEQKEVD